MTPHLTSAHPLRGRGAILSATGAAFLMVAALLFLAPARAEAHAILVQSDPAVNAELRVSPDTVTAFFSESLDTRLSSILVQSCDGTRRDDEDITFGPDPKQMSVGIEQTLDPGFYLVIWETLSSEDGHLLRGSYPFTVLNEDETLPAGEVCDVIASSGSTADIETVSVKWAGLIAATMLLGALAFVVWVNKPSLKDVEEPWRERAREAVRERMRRLAWPAAGALVLVGAGELLLQVRQLGGFEFVDEVLSNNWGERWIQRQVILGGIGVALAASHFTWRGGRRGISDLAVWVAIAGTLGYLLLVAWNSHGNSVPGSFWVIGNDFLHLVGSAVWIGMLAMLALFVLWLRNDIPDEARIDLQASHLQRFSVIAATSVVVLLATGTINGLTQIPNLESFWDTAYGRALAVKLGVMMVLLAVAGLNAFYLRPRTIEESDEGRPADDLRRRMSIAIRVELGLALAVLFVAAILIQYPTSRQVADAEANATQGTAAVVGYEQTQPAGDITVNLTVSPNRPGNNSFRVFLLPEGQDDIGEVLRVRLRFEPPDEGLGTSELELEPAGLLAYTGVGAFISTPGVWDVHVDVRRANVDDLSASFPVEVKSAGVGGQFDMPLANGHWYTVAAIFALVLALVLMIWITDWPDLPELPEFSPRFLRVGSATLSVLAVGVLVLSLLPDSGTASGNPIDPTDESIAIGRSLYTANCQQCHGPDGRGDGPLADTLPVRPVDFRQHVPYHQGAIGDNFLLLIITNGLGSIMPSFGDQLSETERWHIINFLRSEFSTDDTQPGTSPTPSP